MSDVLPGLLTSQANTRRATSCTHLTSIGISYRAITAVRLHVHHPEQTFRPHSLSFSNALTFSPQHFLRISHDTHVAAGLALACCCSKPSHCRGWHLVSMHMHP